MIKADIVADSVSDCGKRITTLSMVYPRFILSEVNTHRTLSRNSASSRAIPTRKLLEQIRTNPAWPVYWGKNRAGMQATEELDLEAQHNAMLRWKLARDVACNHAERMAELNVHKQIVNRIVEPFMHASTVVTATEWDNFFALRRHEAAQPEIKVLADAMWDAMQKSEPKYLKEGEWHLPYFRAGQDDVKLALAHSVARCARVSYNNHEGKETTGAEDERLAKRLAESGHWSPFEHQAYPAPFNPNHRSNNFRGWVQYRETCENERNWQIDTGRSERQKV